MALDDSRAFEFNVTYHPSPYPRAMRDDLNEIALVCDGIYFPFTEADLKYSPRKLRYCVDLAHDANLIAVADFWGFGNLFASAAVPSLYTLLHPEENCVTSRGRAIPKTCPRSAKFREHMKRTVEEFVEDFNVDGVFWDEPQWELPEYLGSLEKGEWACCCEGCKAAFREAFGKDLPPEPTPEVEAFRARSIVELLEELCTYVKGAGEHLITSTCVMPQQSAELKEAVARTRNLDIIGIDPYWRPDMDVSQKEYIDRHTGEMVRLGRANGKLVEAWVCAYDQLARHERDPYRAAKLMAAHDIDALSAWSYRDYQSWSAVGNENAGDPELVWENLAQAYREIRDGNLGIEG